MKTKTWEQNEVFILNGNTEPLHNVLFNSVFQTFHRKKDSLKSLNPEGPLGSYLFL